MLRSAVSLLARSQRLTASGAARQAGAQVRTFAEAPLQEPTVPTHGIHGRYALALFQAGVKEGDLDKIDKDLRAVEKLADGNPMFAQFLRDPSVPKKEKVTALEEILGKIQVSKTTHSFFEVLAENNRLNEVPKIVTTFEELVVSARGQVKATVTTAQKLAQNELAEIKKGLDGLLKKGQTLLLDQKVEPAIIGGVVIDIGDKHIDLSISTRIKKIQQLLTETI
ncbi:ATP synthase subunit O, mitochondrial [Coccomyxa sp. Obi]|nr:ATP synthase subunit O, mitochondrial [Coccomyxa sp. Obi]